MENQNNVSGDVGKNSDLEKIAHVNLHQEPSIFDNSSADQGTSLSLSPYAREFVFNNSHNNYPTTNNIQSGYFTTTTSTYLGFEQNNISNIIDLNTAGEADYEDLDYRNQCEISEELQNILVDSSDINILVNSNEITDYDINDIIDDRDLAVMEELEVEIENTRNQSLGNLSEPFLYSGATPEQNGVLSEHAAEFWFPESRNCACCNGFKHGCKCCAGGERACTFPTCVNQEFSFQVETTLAAGRTNGHDAPSSSFVPRREGISIESRSRPLAKSSFHTNARPTSSGSNLPKFANEFWFPECRDCTCCKGHKHGCDCCKTPGVLTCISPNCINTAFVAGVEAKLAARDTNTDTVQSGSTISTSGLFIQAPSSTSSSSTPSYPPSNSTGGGGRYSGTRVPCNFFAQGYCHHGDFCQFSHDSPANNSNHNFTPYQYPSHSHSEYTDYNAANAAALSYGTSLPVPPTSTYPSSNYYTSPNSYGAPTESEYPDYNVDNSYNNNTIEYCRADQNCPNRGIGGCPLLHTPCDYLLQNQLCQLGRACTKSHEENDLYLYSYWYDNNYNNISSQLQSQGNNRYNQNQQQQPPYNPNGYF